MKRLADNVAFDAALKKGPKTIPQLVKLLGIAYDPIARHVQRLRDLQAIHIADWAEGTDGRKTVMVLALGKGKDAPRPEPLTAAERMRNTRARRRKEAA